MDKKRDEGGPVPAHERLHERGTTSDQDHTERVR